MTSNVSKMISKLDLKLCLKQNNKCIKKEKYLYKSVRHFYFIDVLVFIFLQYFVCLVLQGSNRSNRLGCTCKAHFDAKVTKGLDIKY